MTTFNGAVRAFYCPLLASVLASALLLLAKPALARPGTQISDCKYIRPLNEATNGLEDTSRVRVLREWTHLHETKDLVDITYSIVECNGSKQVLLNVMNENTFQQNLSFVITISDKKNKATPILEKGFNISIGSLQLMKPQCDSDRYSDQKLLLPASVIVADLIISIKVN